MTGLHIAESLDLPIDYATKTAAILAQRRKGKTYSASVLAEELVAVSMPFVALDPTGAWWGLRSSADGKREGLPVVILGGQHGDLPLDRYSGQLVADLAVDHPGYYVLDLSLLESKSAEREFATAFAERLYRRKMQPSMDFPMHLFVDEADMFVPQERERMDTTMLGAFQAIVRRGGLHGLGTTLISQRPALVNKSVLTQLDILILLRLVAGNDQDYVDKNYISRSGSKQNREQLMGSMASLSLGEAWVWEPGAEPPLFERVQIRERRTFNSSATPKAGERRVVPSRLADVDLEAIAAAMSETIERAKADDPQELRSRIRELERRVARAEAERPEPQVRVERVVPPELREAVKSLGELIATTSEELRRRVDDLSSHLELATGASLPTPASVPPGPQPAPTPAAARRPAIEPIRRPRRGRRPSERSPKDRILDALAWFASVGIDPVDRTQLALFAGASPKSSAYANNLGALRTAGLIDYPRQGNITATTEGLAQAEPTDEIRTSEELQAAVIGRLPGPQGRILEELVASYPNAIEKAELAALAGASPTSSAYANNLGALRSLKLVDYPAPGYVVALDVLFLGHAR